MQQKKPSGTSPSTNTKRLYGPVATVFSSTNTGSWRIVRPMVNQAECSKCGTCRKFCPSDVIEINDDPGACVVIDWNFCKGCGICANVCVKKCIAMVDESIQSNKPKM